MANILHGQRLRTGLSTGTGKLARILGPDYGPNGRTTVCDQKYDIPLVVNTGKKILPDFTLEDPVENLGAVLLRDAILQGDFSSGDGTIVTAVLADAMIKEGMKAIANGISPIALRKGIRKASRRVQEVLQNAAVSAQGPDVFYQVARIASDSEKIGQLVAEAFETLGPEGIIHVADSQQTQNRLELTMGIQYDYGFYSSTFANDEPRRTASMEKPYVLLINHRVRQPEQLEKILIETAEKQVPLCVIASDLDDPVVHFILANVRRGVVQVLAGHAPGHGDTRRRNMQALAAKTGAVVIDEECGLELAQCGLEVCGRVDSVWMDKDNTNLQGFPMEDPETVSHLRTYVTSLLAEADTPEKREKLELTLSMLCGGMATIYAGGYSEFEMFENQHRIENAVSAVYSAIRTGILPGGGKSYLLAVPVLDELLEDCDEDDSWGILCVRNALMKPAGMLADNAGDNGSYIVAKLLEAPEQPFYGYDVAQHCFCDLRAAGIVDPMGSTCIAFQSAAETAASVLTIESAVFLEK